MKPSKLQFPNYSDVLHVCPTNIQLVNIGTHGSESYAAQMKRAVEGLDDADFAEAGLKANTVSTYNHPIKGKYRAALLTLGTLSDAPSASYRIFQSDTEHTDEPCHVVGVSNIMRHSESVSPTTKQERLLALAGRHHRDLGDRALSGYINEHKAQAPVIDMAEVAFEETIKLAHTAGLRKVRVSKMQTPKVKGLTVIEHVVDLPAAGFEVVEDADPLVVNDVAYPGENWVLNIAR